MIGTAIIVPPFAMADRFGVGIVISIIVDGTVAFALTMAFPAHAAYSESEIIHWSEERYGIEITDFPFTDDPVPVENGATVKTKDGDVTASMSDDHLTLTRDGKELRIP